MMNKFTFIAQYKGGTYISQYDAAHVWCGAISACGNFLIVNIVKTA